MADSYGSKAPSGQYSGPGPAGAGEIDGDWNAPGRATERMAGVSSEGSSSRKPASGEADASMSYSKKSRKLPS